MFVAAEEPQSEPERGGLLSQSCGPPFPFNMLPRVRTMHTSSKLPSGALLCALLLLLSRGAAAGADQTDAESEEALSPRALRDFYPKGPNLTSEKQLVRSASPRRLVSILRA